MSSNSQSKHIVVIGAGIVGLSCAFYLRRSGFKVTILDGLGQKRSASIGNAGVIATADHLPLGTIETLLGVPGMLVSPNSPLRIRPAYLPQITPWLIRMAAASMPAQVKRISDALATILRSALEAHCVLARTVGAESLLRSTGYLRVYETETGFAKSRDERRSMEQHGIPFEILDRDAIQAFDPLLAPIFARAIWNPACHSIESPERYVTKVRDYLLNDGVKIEQALVSDFVTQDGVVSAALTQLGPIRADGFVLAAGAWSKSLAKRLGSHIPLDTERGYHMMLSIQSNETLRAPILWTDRSIVMSPIEGGIRVTSSVEFAGLHRAPDFQLVHKSLPAVKLAIRSLEDTINTSWLGFRPSMPDSSPVIGPSQHYSNAWLAFGHGHLGLTLGPETGRRIARLVAGQTPSNDIEAFSPSRFN